MARWSRWIAAALLLCFCAEAHAQPVTPEATPALVETEAPPVAPAPEMERPTVWGEPTEVKISIYVLDVDNVNSADQSFAASVYIEARWRSPSLQHAGPGPLVRGLTEIWTPRLAIVNQQQAWAAFPAAVEIDPDGNVVYRQKYWGRFSQPLDLRDFPLDQQKLTIHLVAAGQFESDVKLVQLERAHGRRSGVARILSVPDFDVVAWKAEPRPYLPYESEVGTAGFALDLDIQRRPTFYIWKVIVPLCLIVIMSWTPFWIDPSQIATSIGVATTSFLTLVAYLFAITVLLPRVSYLTRMDEFILLSTVMVFISLAQTVVSGSLLKRRSPPAVVRLNRWSRVIYPLVLLAVVGASFLR